MQPIVFGDLLVKPAERKVVVRNHELRLSEKETYLLAALASGGRRSREQLLRDTHPYDPLPAGERSIDVLVSKLRSKLASVASGGNYIESLRWHGYRLCPEPLYS